MKLNILKRAGLAAICMAVVGWSACVSADEADPALPPGPDMVAPVEHRGIEVTIDQAKVIRIDHDADTVIIGNPAIADATLFDRRTLVITGRAYGSTNLLILDDKGELVVDEFLRVQPATDSMVRVQRRNLSFTYSCTPLCKPSISPGDQNEFFDDAIKQSETRNSIASKAAGVN